MSKREDEGRKRPAAAPVAGLLSDAGEEAEELPLLPEELLEDELLEEELLSAAEEESSEEDVSSEEVSPIT